MLGDDTTVAPTPDENYTCAQQVKVENKAKRADELAAKLETAEELLKKCLFVLNILPNGRR